MRDAWQLAKDSSEFDKTVLYFMTDGEAAYPGQAIQRFNQDPSLMKTIEFQGVAFGRSANTGVIQQMANAFHPNGTMTPAPNASELQKTFEEIERPIYVEVHEPLLEWICTLVEKYAPNWLVHSQMACYLLTLALGHFQEKVRKVQIPNITGFALFLVLRFSK